MVHFGSDNSCVVAPGASLNGQQADPSSILIAAMWQDLFPRTPLASTLRLRVRRCVSSGDIPMRFRARAAAARALGMRAAPSNADANAPSLLIVPASLIANWRSEIRKFAPALGVFYGSSGKLESGMRIL